jgi:hypothetical protein
MSTITNEPILLDSTGQALLDEMKIQSGHLAMIAEGSRTQVYSSMRQIADLVRGGDVARNTKMFPIGDQIIMPWKDMDDSVHNTDETAYQVAWDIVHHGEVELRDGSIVPGMFIQMHLCSAYGVQLSHQQAFMNCPEGLAAGTYHVTFGAKWGSKGADAGTTWQFTLTQDVPAGGRISGFEGLPDQEPANWRIKTWATPDSADPIETVTVTSGDSGMDLGTMQYASVGEDGLNSMQATGYGHNRWSTSALRQYLNKSGANWWVSQEDFDIRPDQYAKQGFMTGFDAEFLNAIKPVKVTTALNTVEGFTDATEDTFDTFFLPSLQQMNVSPQLANVEGDVFEYWRSRLGKNTYVGTGSSNVFDAFKIPALNSNSAQTVRLRSAYRGNAHNTWIVTSSGYVNYNTASAASRFSPVCVIC